MNPGERFERHCFEYLERFYSTEKTKFRLSGGMDSTKSDIAVVKNGRVAFFIEVKDALAQSGQFVLLPDEDEEIFVFSPQNHSEPNEMTDIIIDYMNSNFHRFNNAGTAGEALDIDTSIFANWIIEHYKDRNVKYVISCDEDYVILPIRKFKQYFDIIAKYRIKKSGSGKPAKRDIPAIKQMIKDCYSSAKFVQYDNKLFVNMSERIYRDRFVLGDYTYYLSERSLGVYEIRRLSNTYNMNVIFSIELIKAQDENDLEEFISEL